MKVPFLDLRPAHEELAKELDVALARVLRSGWFVLGPEVERFEEEFARYVGVDSAVGVGSGLDALHLMLRACEVGPGDEVLVPAHTFVATWLAVMHAGARPVPVDVDPTSGMMTAAGCAAALGPRTRAILVVHLYGCVADLAGLRKLADEAGVLLLEDAAQAHGARISGRRAGAGGDAAAFSFYPSKNLGALGDGGAVVTSRPELAARVRALRSYGGAVRHQHELLGFNSRLDELQAAVLRVKLRHLDNWNARRAAVARRYLAELPDALALPDPGPDEEPVWHLFVVGHPRRDALGAALGEAGVATSVHYPTPPHLTPACASLGHDAGAFPVAERLAKQVLSLPMGPHLTEEQVKHTIESARRVVAELR